MKKRHVAEWLRDIFSIAGILVIINIFVDFYPIDSSKASQWILAIAFIIVAILSHYFKK